MSTINTSMYRLVHRRHRFALPLTASRSRVKTKYLLLSSIFIFNTDRSRQYDQFALDSNFLSLITLWSNLMKKLIHIDY